MPVNKETAPETKSVAVGPTLDESFENIFEALGEFVKTAKTIQIMLKIFTSSVKHSKRKSENRVTKTQVELVLSKELCNFLKVHN